MLENISYELSAKSIQIITPSCLQSYRNKYLIPISWVPFVSHRLKSMPIWFRFPFLFWDGLIALLVACSSFSSNSESELVVLIGTDLLGLFRGFASSLICKPRRTSVYIVDNFLVKYPGNTCSDTGSSWFLRVIARYILSFYHNIYFITDTLCESYMSMLDLPPHKTRVIGLPYVFDFDGKSTPPIRAISGTQDNPRLKFAYIGLLTPLTISCLSEIFEWLDLHKQICNFYLFSSNYSKSQFSLKFTSCISIKHYPINSDQIYSVIPMDTVFICPHFMPCSFNPSKFTKSLVKESFPSKLLKMISLGYPVMLISDKGAAVTRSHSKYVFSLRPSRLSSTSPQQAYTLSVRFYNSTNRSDLVKMHSVLNLFPYSHPSCRI